MRDLVSVEAPVATTATKASKRAPWRRQLLTGWHCSTKL